MSQLQVTTCNEISTGHINFVVFHVGIMIWQWSAVKENAGGEWWLRNDSK